MRSLLHINGITYMTRETFLCSECEINFEDKQYHSDHMNSYHLKIKPHKCKTCLLSFSQMVQLKQHVNNNHLYHCTVRKCSIAYFSRWDELEAHINTYHLELKRQLCATCNNFPLNEYGSTMYEHDPNCLLRHN